MSLDARKVQSALPKVSVAYEDGSNLAEARESVISRNRYTQDVSNPAFGSSSNVFEICPDALTGNVVMYIQLRENAATTLADLARGWGYRFVRQIRYQYANSAEHQLSGDSNLLACMRECETNYKKGELLRLGGQASATTEALDSPDKRTAVVCLNLPTSKMCQGKPVFDAGLLKSSIRISVDFADSADMLPAGSAGQLTNADIERVYFQNEQFKFSDPGADRMVIGSGSYDYYHYSVQSSCAFVDINTDPQSGCASQASLQLRDFKKGSLSSISMALVEVDPATNKPINPTDNVLWTPADNVEVEFEGNVIYRGDNRNEQIWCLQQSMSDCSFPSLGDPAGDPGRSVWTQIPISEFDESCLKQLVQYGSDLGGLTLKIAFNARGASAASPKRYKVFFNYNYTASLRVDGSGSARFVF